MQNISWVGLSLVMFLVQQSSAATSTMIVDNSIVYFSDDKPTISFEVHKSTSGPRFNEVEIRKKIDGQVPMIVQRYCEKRGFSASSPEGFEIQYLRPETFTNRHTNERLNTVVTQSYSVSTSLEGNPNCGFDGQSDPLKSKIMQILEKHLSLAEANNNPFSFDQSKERRAVRDALLEISAQIKQDILHELKPGG